LCNLAGHGFGQLFVSLGTELFVSLGFGAIICSTNKMFLSNGIHPTILYSHQNVSKQDNCKVI